MNHGACREISTTSFSWPWPYHLEILGDPIGTTSKEKFLLKSFCVPYQGPSGDSTRWALSMTPVNNIHYMKANNSG